VVIPRRVREGMEGGGVVLAESKNFIPLKNIFKKQQQKKDQVWWLTPNSLRGRDQEDWGSRSAWAKC
jgi:hypothetical protein